MIDKNQAYFEVETHENSKTILTISKKSYFLVRLLRGVRPEVRHFGRPESRIKPSFFISVLSKVLLSYQKLPDIYRDAREKRLLRT